jgi:phage terminase large subunit
LKELVKRYEYPYKARDAFLDFHHRKERWAVLVCHRRAGKTVATICDIIRRAVTENKPDARYAYIAPYYAQAKNIAWDYLLKYAAPAIVKANQSELWVELVNGAKIRLFGADNPDALRGLYLDGVVLDEYADMKMRLWGEIVRPLLTDRNGLNGHQTWAVFIGTPKGHNAFYDIYNEAQKNPNWYVKTLRADQSGLIAEAELLDAQATMSDNQYEQEFLCSFEAAILGAYYGQEMRRITDLERITTVDYDPMFPCHTAWDLGFNDSTSIWWFQVVYGEIRVLDHHSSNGQAIPFYTMLLQQKEDEFGYKYGYHYLPHDARAKTLASGGKSIIEQISAKIDIKHLKIVPNLSLQDGIQASRLALTRCWFDNRCEEGIECLRQYQREWDDDKKIFRDRPKHDWTSHSADAFRYLAIVWKDEDSPILSDARPKGLHVGQTDVTLNEMWKSTPKITNTRI